MLGEALVQERIVGVQQFHYAAVFAQDVLEEEFGLLLETLAQAFVKLREDIGVGLLLGKIADVEPLAGEIGDQGIRARIVKKAPDLLIEHGRVLQFALFREVQKLIVGDGAPKEEREPRGQVQIANAVDSAGSGARGILFDAEEEIGRDEQRAESLLDSEIKIALFAAAAVEGEQGAKIGVGDRAAEGAVSHGGE